MIASMLTVQGMYGLQLQRYAPYIGILVFIFSFIANYFLINNIGIYGAAWGYVLAEVLEIVFVFLLLFHRLKKRKVVL